MTLDDLYSVIVAKIFADKYREGATEVAFSRDEMLKAADDLDLERPKNVGDVAYSFRFRRQLPASITSTAPEGKEWIISGRGRSKYAFELATISRVRPNLNLVDTKIPDATPEIVLQYSQSDEQALLAKIRYNRLLDIFLGVTTYSLQNHLRTTVPEIGQLEIDEVYVGVNTRGAHFIIPVQAKTGTDQIGIVQIRQDLAWCRSRFPEQDARPVAAQSMSDDRIALFELTEDGGEMRIVDERHYRLVHRDDISAEDLLRYKPTSPQ